MSDFDKACRAYSYGFLTYEELQTILAEIARDA